MAAGLYSWSKAESIMRLARRNSLPNLPNNLTELAILFENGLLERFACCNLNFFRACVTDNENKTNVIFACRQLINIVLENNITEIHADATFKVIPRNMGYQLFTLHCMIQNYVRLIYDYLKFKT